MLKEKCSRLSESCKGWIWDPPLSKTLGQIQLHYQTFITEPDFFALHFIATSYLGSSIGWESNPCDSPLSGFEYFLQTLLSRSNLWSKLHFSLDSSDNSFISIVSENVKESVPIRFVWKNETKYFFEKVIADLFFLKHYFVFIFSLFPLTLLSFSFACWIYVLLGGYF
jgi:hypothetical protein